MKTRVRYTGPGASAVTWFEGSVRRRITQIQDIVEDAAEAGKNITKHHIETRGTAKSGKRGRVETRAMLDAVNSRTEHRDKRGVKSKFGWIDEFKDYFGYQEDGFDHVNGVTVEGMYALTDAAEEVFTDLERDIERVIYGS